MKNKFAQIKDRASGILVPISALPSKYGIGSLGQHARQFVDFLTECKQSYWQILPTTVTGYGDSPYQSCSVSAMSEYFIDIDKLIKSGLLKKSEVCDSVTPLSSRVDYEKLFNERYDLLRIAFGRFDQSNANFQRFVTNGKFFDYALFRTLSHHHNFKCWTEWGCYKDRSSGSVEKFAVEHSGEILFWQWCQFEVRNQWNALKRYANKKGIELIGDMPIYASHDSVECWTNRENFQLDIDGKLTAVAGCPPDYFSADGQLWGNPLYNWEQMKADDYAWWGERLSSSLELFDVVRIDHFRGFDRYYSIPYGDSTARNGEWKQAPSTDMFIKLGSKLGDMPLIAEDLGTLDQSALEMFSAVGYPGMKILVYAFSGEDNLYLPSNYGSTNCVVYAGTHDNDTVLGHVREVCGDSKNYMASLIRREFDLLGIACPPLDCDEQICDSIVQLAYASKARLAIMQLQDLMLIGSDGRMNKPSTLSTENWSYRIEDDYASSQLIDKIKNLTEQSGR